MASNRTFHEKDEKNEIMKIWVDTPNDGTIKEELHILGPGSGFLALDKNHDGTLY